MNGFDLACDHVGDVEQQMKAFFRCVLVLEHYLAEVFV